MKKIISIILSVVLLTSFFTMNISAQEATTKTESLINQIEETKTISIKLSDSVVENDFTDITDLRVMFKVQNDGNILSDLKIAASAKVGFISARAIFGEENIVYAPGLRCYVDLNEFVEIETFDFKLVATGLDKLLDYFSSEYFNLLPLTFAGEKEVKGYGNVYVERFGMVSEFYYKGDTLVGFRALNLDKEDPLITFDSRDVFPATVEGISSGVDSSMFEKPSGFYINLTPLVKFIYDLAMSLR